MVSTRAAYAFYGVAYLAYRADDAPIPFPEILTYLTSLTKQLTLSPGYISKVFQDLSRSGLVRAVPGRKGGYSLARAPKDVLLSDVLMASDGQPRLGCCQLSVGGCGSGTHRAVHKVVHGAEEAFYGSLATESAYSLARKVFSTRGRKGSGAAGKATGGRKAAGGRKRVTKKTTKKKTRSAPRARRTARTR